MEKTNLGYYKKILEHPPKAFGEWFKAEEEFLTINIKKDSSILFIGCGDGREINYLIGKTKKLVGIDHDKNAIKNAKENLIDYPEVKLIIAEAEKLPFKNRSFDYVLCMGTFTNLGIKKYNVLSEMKRVLREQGRIILSCYSEDAWEERIKIYKKLGVPILETKGTTIIIDYELEDNISEQFSKKQLEEIFLKSKLKVEEIKKIGIGYICMLKKQKGGNTHETTME